MKLISILLDIVIAIYVLSHILSIDIGWFPVAFCAIAIRFPLGWYLSRKEVAVKFSASVTKLPDRGESYVHFAIVNRGHPPACFENVSISKNREGGINIYSGTNGRFLEMVVDTDLAGGSGECWHEIPHSICLANGEMINVFVDLEGAPHHSADRIISTDSLRKFFGEGDKFYVQDTDGNKFYLSRKGTNSLKEIV